MSLGFIFAFQCCKTVVSTQFVLDNFHPPRTRQVKHICEEEQRFPENKGCSFKLLICFGTATAADSGTADSQTTYLDNTHLMGGISDVQHYFGDTIEAHVNSHLGYNL